MIQSVETEPVLSEDASREEVLAATKTALEQILLLSLQEGRGDLYLDRNGSWTLEFVHNRLYAAGPDGKEIDFDLVGVELR